MLYSRYWQYSFLLYHEPQYIAMARETKDSTITIRVTPAIKALAMKRATVERRSLAQYIAVLIERDAEAADLSLLPGNFPGTKRK
jgi:hypothetical protein